MERNRFPLKFFTFLILICLFTVPSFGSKDDDWRCGEHRGKCKKGYCCSRYGWCGKSNEYCNISKGCQSKFGKCNINASIGEKKDNEIIISTDGRCGENRGKCMKGYCCSIFGWCGKSDEYCDISKGCQSKFGKCNFDRKEKDSKSKEEKDENENEKIHQSKDSRCGESRGKCEKGYCCSKYGWCGKSDEYCDISKGCQSKFGKCNFDRKILKVRKKKMKMKMKKFIKVRIVDVVKTVENVKKVTVVVNMDGVVNPMDTVMLGKVVNLNLVSVTLVIQ